MQMEFSWRDDQTLRTELERHAGCRIELILTDNRHSMLSVKHLGARGLLALGTNIIRLRLHRMFLTAEPEVVAALGHWLKTPRSKKVGGIIDAFIRQNLHEIRTYQPRAMKTITVGETYDLEGLFRKINTRYFDNAVTAVITWGKMPTNFSRRRRAVRSIRFGSYSKPDNLIRIHPVLDSPKVPPYFIEYIVYHEMLHAVVEYEKTASGQVRCHTRQFRERERAFEAYPQAVDWLNQSGNLEHLFRARRTP